MIKEKLKNIWQNVSTFFRLAIPVTIGVGLLWSMYWFVKGGYYQIFVPQKEIVTIKLTNADSIIIERQNSCASDYFDSSAYISRTSDDVKTNSYTIKSSNPIQFSINLPDAELVVAKYIGDKTIYDNSVTVDPNMRYKGTIKSLFVQVTNMRLLRLQEFYCAKSVEFLPIGGMRLSNLDGSNLQISTVQGFYAGDIIKIIIEPIGILDGVGNQKYDKIELNLKVTKDTAMGIGTEKSGVRVEMTYS